MYASGHNSPFREPVPHPPEIRIIHARITDGD